AFHSLMKDYVRTPAMKNYIVTTSLKNNAGVIGCLALAKKEI
ncbi:fructokinase, partial [Escherichia coli]|nr:fructokinase [Escherichia coli]